MEATKEKHATFTPGPWEIQDSGPGTIRGLRFRVVTDEKFIAKTSDGLEEARANARLIAAAPEMYEMLKELEGGLLARARYKGSKTIDKLREILAKVDGGEG